ncbi:MAG TPA: amino acid adenylation domain-containing protein [Terriglobales bacterium]|nr:amino acid adenylation domain-containing protein [Terriglobales bacterium]
MQPRQAFLGLVQILLHRHTLAETVEIGMEADALFNARNSIDSSSSVREILHKASGSVRDHADRVCWNDLQTTVNEATLPPGASLFRLLLRFHDPAMSTEPIEFSQRLRAQSDMVLTACERQDAMDLQAEYDADLYDETTIQRILRQISFLCQSLDMSLDQAVGRIPLCFSDEVRALVLGPGAEGKTFPVIDQLHRRVEERARKFPGAVAITMPGSIPQQMTYSELNERANRLARHLREKGVGPNVLVGLYLNRTANLIVGMLAILKAGGAYLPIDLSYPPERVSFMLSEAESLAVITDAQTAANLPRTQASVIRIDQDEGRWAELSSKNLEPNGTPDDLAYCIFTSGSTGKPKGVLITHKNVARLFDATEEWFRFSENDTWTFFHSPAFDFSVWEIWGALLYGGRLVVVSFADSRSPHQFYDVLAAEGVTVLNQTPSAFRQLVGVDEAKPQRKLDRLRLVIFGGEALNLQSLAPWFGKYGDAHPQLVNMYGITETTVHVTYRPLSIDDLTNAPGSVIGRPIPDLQLHILDANLQPVPVGVPGEMFVGGAGVARGYLKRDALTSERFIPDPFSPHEGERLYRSGDLARRLANGDVEYLGRSDQQVKIRGFRIELGEVQAALTRQPSVREAFVMATETAPGEKALVAYVVAANGQQPAVDKLRRDLQETLPSYMVPSRFVFLDKLPLTGNGKVDRAALPALDTRRSNLQQAFLAPQSDMERDIAQIYREVLNVDKVGVDDDFFDLGGNSLRLAEAHSRLQKLLGRTFSVTDLFVHTTVRKLAGSFHHTPVPKGLGVELINRAQRQREAMSAGRERRR